MRSQAQIDEADVDRVLSALGSGHFLLTSQHGGKRAGITTRWVMACAHTPLLVSAAVHRGHWIAPIIRDSHAFAICAVDPGATLLLRKCAETCRPRDGDPFDFVPTTRLATGSPIVEGDSLALDCEVRRHIDLEADYELYVGLVLATRIDGVVTRFSTSECDHQLDASRSMRGPRR